jgi:hypothetical protein
MEFWNERTDWHEKDNMKKTTRDNAKQDETQNEKTSNHTFVEVSILVKAHAQHKHHSIVV